MTSDTSIYIYIYICILVSLCTGTVQVWIYMYIYILQLSVTAACKASKCREDDPESVQVEGGWRCAVFDDGDIMGI